MILQHVKDVIAVTCMLNLMTVQKKNNFLRIQYQRLSPVAWRMVLFVIIYVAAKATYIRLLHGKIGFFWGGRGRGFGPSSVKRGRSHIAI